MVRFTKSKASGVKITKLKATLGQEYAKAFFISRGKTVAAVRFSRDQPAKLNAIAPKAYKAALLAGCFDNAEELLRPRRKKKP